MEYITLGVFCASLFACLLLDISILYALGLGLVLFTAYGVRRGYAFKTVLNFALSGIKTVKNILITLLLVGMLTALWRAAGTIPTIVCLAVRLIRPSIFLLMTFLLNCMISLLTGTAIGSAATMGVICATMGVSMGVSPLLLGGAILSGVFFGDRCSPVSTSALLVAALTDTDIYGNIKGMLRSARVPFLLCCVIYGCLGFFLGSRGEVPDLAAVFGGEFHLSLAAAIPAAVLLVLALCKVNVKAAMGASLIAALPICLFLQHMEPGRIPELLLMGYKAKNAEVAAMLNGGGILSMLRVTAIICISSAYAGIFRNTGLLTHIKSTIQKLAARTTPFAAVFLTSILTGMIACNQALTIMLTDQLTRELVPDTEGFAQDLEDTAVLTAALIPWSTASVIPLTTVGAPMLSIAFAFFLYLQPLWRLAGSVREKGQKRRG